MTRNDHLLKCVKLNGSGLEIGPLHAPIVKKENNRRIYYLDHAPREELVKKYATVNKKSKDGIDVGDIVEVDYVLDRSIKHTVRNNSFDYVIASHVVEHIPDTVSWFKDIAQVLKPGGILTLAVPDKRFTFDITRNESRPADTIGAYFDKLQQAYTSTVYDFVVNYRDKVIPKEVWDNPDKDFSYKPKMYTAAEALKKCADNLDPNTYVDVHCNIYTPHSFLEIIRSLIEQDLFDYEVAYFHETERNDMEFHVSFKKSSKSKKQKLASIPKIKAARTEYDLVKKIRQLETKIEELESSRSWKVTKPLREINALKSRKR